VRGFGDEERETGGLDLYDWGDGGRVSMWGSKIDRFDIDMAFSEATGTGNQIKCLPLFSRLAAPGHHPASCSRCGALYNTAQYLFNSTF
jgi:hypothetical protein